MTVLELPARFDQAAEQLALADELLARGPTDLALLPEASLTGYVSPEGDFDLRPFAEPRDGATARALADLARKHRTRVVGPLVESAGGAFFNAMVGFDAAGREILHYKKRHPWYPETWATPGDAPHPVVAIGGLRVSIAICFDLHFAPAELPPCDLLLFPSAWVETETNDSRVALLRALNVHVLNANWGPGEPRVPGQGDSCILHASGAVLARGAPRVDAVIEPH